MPPPVPRRPSHISIEGLSHRFGSFEALSEVGFRIERGEFLTLLGPSGSGKTTLLNCLAGFLVPTRGAILREGADITHLAVEKRDFGMVFQGYALFPHMTAFQNIAYPLVLRRRPRAEIRRRGEAMLALVGLSERGHYRPSELSGGQQQRVAIARALVFEPQLLLLDEPLAALDKALRKELQKELQRIHREVGTTFVFVTHDQEEALNLSDRIAVFDHGRLRQLADPLTLYRRPANRFVAGFIGEVTLLPVRRAVREGVMLRVETGGMRAGMRIAVRLPDGDLGGAGFVGIRPEFVQVGARPGTATANRVAVTVAAVDFFGAHVEIVGATAGGTLLRARLHQRDWLRLGLAPGEATEFCWAEDDCFVVPAEDDGRS